MGNKDTAEKKNIKEDELLEMDLIRDYFDEIRELQMEIMAESRVIEPAAAWQMATTRIGDSWGVEQVEQIKKLPHFQQIYNHLVENDMRGGKSWEEYHGHSEKSSGISDTDAGVIADFLEG